ncbi:PhoH family protein [uncultured Pseudoramibacter sp.]|uniref:PhoH-like protein n=1 Tax=Candidatus Pseudoramibacter fermentans TaxID=2594427 RepID=A0A6L5GQK5_9FIRM|nr:PhoH family protein [uncultured Pseudoramibacter sp.]MQM72531.1 PhoH family protein [Candidatus Pseudoramibacter fermentans]RRF91924.1 MAG: PhoH family protein [Eubacteriaceae bacterium]
MEKVKREILIDSADVLTPLFGEYDANVKQIEKSFGVHINVRDSKLTVTGEAPGVEGALAVIGDMVGVIKKDKGISADTTHYLIEMRMKGINSQYAEMMDDIICFTTRGKPIKAKTLGQHRYIDAIRHNDIVFGIGPAGTGKTYLAMAMAITAFKNGDVSRLILTRPAVEAGEKLGFLPGDLQDKVDPYLRPLYDALFEIMGPEAFERNMEKGLIEVAPLAYMRGRTLENAYIILDEAQNTTPAQMKMFLTRFGAGSKVIVTGDVTQIDLPSGKRSGLIEAQRVLKGIKGIDFIEFDYSDVVRHRLVQRIIEAYEKYDQTRAAHQESEADSEEKDAPRRRKHHDHH